MKKDGGSAFPVKGEKIQYFGMSLRDWFAGMVISPMLMQAYGSTPKILAKQAYEIADAMIAEREKE